MKRNVPLARRGNPQSGYALTVVVFMLALLVIASVAVAPDIITNGRREKEEEMIWRGKQYVRGIRLYVRYYQTHGGGATKFPTSMEDLTTNKVGIRFMRQAYKDPVNSVDGSWRLIYVGPNGQLIGSLKDRPLNPSAFTNGAAPGGSQSPVGTSASGGSSFGSSSFGSSSFGSSSNGSSFGNSSFGSSSFGNNTNSSGFGSNNGSTNALTQNGAPGGIGSTQTGDTPPDQMSTPQPLSTSNNNTEIIGGNIIGVGSKVNKKSVIWYDKAKNYRQFEFVWDPSKDPVNGGAAPQVGVSSQNGSSLFNSANGTQGTGPGQQSSGTGFGQQPGVNGNGSFGGGMNGNSGNNTNPPAQNPPVQNPPQ